MVRPSSFLVSQATILQQKRSTSGCVTKHCIGWCMTRCSVFFILGSSAINWKSGASTLIGTACGRWCGKQEKPTNGPPFQFSRNKAKPILHSECTPAGGFEHPTVHRSLALAGTRRIPGLDFQKKLRCAPRNCMSSSRSSEVSSPQLMGQAEGTLFWDSYNKDPTI